MTTFSENFKFSYFKISNMNLFLPALDIYVITCIWNIPSCDFLAMHASLYHLVFCFAFPNWPFTEKAGIYLLWVPLHAPFPRNRHTTQYPYSHLHKSRMLKLILIVAQISVQRNYLLPTWVHLQPCRMLSLCIHISNIIFWNHDCS